MRVRVLFPLYSITNTILDFYGGAKTDIVSNPAKSFVGMTIKQLQIVTKTK